MRPAPAPLNAGGTGGRAEHPLELWVGVEPTVNRVGDDFLHQLERSGFHARLGDLDRLQSLGATRVRFPVLWERVAPDQPGEHDWTWTDSRLARLRELQLTPIAGLLHHGSGPRYTSLTDPRFPERFARYARAVAERYPWLDAWTPVNEPLTTARFSGLYGHWYPHGRHHRDFIRALLNQVRATVLAMRAIRSVNPAAQLVQTEDLGFTHGTPALQYQADFENQRRWLSFDLLTGRVDARHPLWNYLLSAGASEAELLDLAGNPCPPDVLGVNAYVTSERFLDDRLERYPAHLHGGNGQDRYVDVEALRVLGAHIEGFAGRLREAQRRYGRPIAITETHLGCTREEQLRWLHETWRTARTVRNEGVDLRAVTVWSAFGAFDWDSLLTRNRGHYEPGVWDVRAPEPRPTALVNLARELAAGREPSHPVLDAPGWWRRDLRLLYPPHGEVQADPSRGRPLLIVGEDGPLRRAFTHLCHERGLNVQMLAGHPDDAALRGSFELHQPWAVVNPTSSVNPQHTTLLAGCCAAFGVPLLAFTLEPVFDGGKEAPYVEGDAPNPSSLAGHQALLAEQAALRTCPAALVVRSTALFGSWESEDFVTCGQERLRRGQPWRVPRSRVVSPTFIPDLVHHSLDLLIDGERGVWHLANDAALSLADFARLAARTARLDEALVRDVDAAAGFSGLALTSERGWIMPELERALERHLEEPLPATANTTPAD